MSGTSNWLSGQNPNINPKTGKPWRTLNPAQRLATTLNWYKRMVMGARGTTNFYQVGQQARHLGLSKEQKIALDLMAGRASLIAVLLKEQQDAVAEFHKLPKAGQSK